MFVNIIRISCSIFRSWGITLLLSPVSVLLPTSGFAMDITLQWDANIEKNLAGYYIYYDKGTGGPYNGTGAQEGNSPVDVPLAQDENPDPGIVEFTIHNLPDGTYYFTVTAYNNKASLPESGYSNEVYSYFALDNNPVSPGSGGGGGCFISALQK